MLKKILNKNGLTLTELLVSSMLMGIVMVGVAGFSVGIKRMQDSTDKQAIVAYHAAIAMAYFERMIAQTYGSMADDTDTDGAGPDTVIPTYLFNVVANPRDYWSFRADPNRTPSNSADDIWQIFWSPRAGVDNQTLYYCTKPYNPADADANNFAGGQACSPSNRMVVLYRNMVGNPTFTRVSDNSPSTLDQRFDISITLRFNPAVAIDPMDNPGYTMSSSIAMLQYSNNPTP